MSDYWIASRYGKINGMETSQKQNSVKESRVIETEENDSDDIAHIIRKSEWGKAYIMGEPVVALCGKKWVPHKDPEEKIVCKKCMVILERIASTPNN